jgi:hypothetical protein
MTDVSRPPLRPLVLEPPPLRARRRDHREDGAAAPNASVSLVGLVAFLVVQVRDIATCLLSTKARPATLSVAQPHLGGGNAARSMIRSSASSSSSVSLARSHPTFSSTACDGLPCPRSSSAVAAAIRAAGGAFPSRITPASVSIASCVSARAAAFTVTKICLAAIVSGRRGRPPGLPDTPGLKLVERLPPRGIA